MVPILVSACLLGERVRHHGGDARFEHPLLTRWRDEGRLVPVCPEVLGGLGTPRPPAEIVGDRVMTKTGDDVTAAFGRGAALAADEARAHGAAIAILKSNSPSCGTGVIYDGTFSGAKVAGDGRTAALLRSRGIAVFSEEEIDAAAAYLGENE